MKSICASIRYFETCVLKAKVALVQAAQHWSISFGCPTNSPEFWYNIKQCTTIVVNRPLIPVCDDVLLQDKKRQEVEKKLEEKARAEKEEVKKERQALFTERKRKQEKIRQLETKMELVKIVSVLEKPPTLQNAKDLYFQNIADRVPVV